MMEAFVEIERKENKRLNNPGNMNLCGGLASWRWHPGGLVLAVKISKTLVGKVACVCMTMISDPGTRDGRVTRLHKKQGGLLMCAKELQITWAGICSWLRAPGSLNSWQRRAIASRCRGRETGNVSRRPSESQNLEETTDRACQAD